MPCISPTDLYDFSPRARRGFYQLQTRKVESLRRPSNRLQFSSLLHSSQPASARQTERAQTTQSPFWRVSKSFMCIKMSHLPPPDGRNEKKRPASNLVSNPGAHIMICWGHARSHASNAAGAQERRQFFDISELLIASNVIFYSGAVAAAGQATYSIYHIRGAHSAFPVALPPTAEQLSSLLLFHLSLYVFYSENKARTRPNLAVAFYSKVAQRRGAMCEKEVGTHSIPLYWNLKACCILLATFTFKALSKTSEFLICSSGDICMAKYLDFWRNFYIALLTKLNFDVPELKCRWF